MKLMEKRRVILACLTVVITFVYYTVLRLFPFRQLSSYYGLYTITIAIGYTLPFLIGFFLVFYLDKNGKPEIASGIKYGIVFLFLLVLAGCVSSLIYTAYTLTTCC